VALTVALTTRPVAAMQILAERGKPLVNGGTGVLMLSALARADGDARAIAR